MVLFSYLQIDKEWFISGLMKVDYILLLLGECFEKVIGSLNACECC